MAITFGSKPPVVENSAQKSALKSYVSTCAAKASAWRVGYTVKKYRSWADLGVAIPPMFDALPFDYTTLTQFCNYYQTSAEARFLAEEAAAQQRTVKLTYTVADEQVAVRQVGRFKLKPRQRKAIDQCVEALAPRKDEMGHWTPSPVSAVVVPLEPGEGKSVIGWALVRHWQTNMDFGQPMTIPMFRYMFLTKRSVVIPMQRRAKDCAVAGIPTKTAVLSHTELITRNLSPYFEVTKKVLDNDEEIEIFNWRLPPPALIIIDECQDYKKRTSAKSKRLLAIVEAGKAAGSKFVFMSATPFVTVNDTWLFAIASGKKFRDEPITIDNFASFARAIAARAGARPDEPDEGAMREFWKEFQDCTVLPPRDKRTVKAFNRTLELEFKTPEDRAQYDRAWAKYLEIREAEGKGGFGVNPMTAFTVFRAAEERLKAKYFADLAVESHAKGFAPIVGVCYQDSVKEFVRRLVYVHGVPRDKISVIKGNDDLVTKEKIAKDLGPEVFGRIGSLIVRYMDPGQREFMSTEEKRATKKYLKWARDQVRYEDTEESQAARHTELLKLRLSNQTAEQRQNEIDKFQNGETEYCIFTLSTGGTGVDLDHQVEGVRPREGFFTICYWAEEFLQALGRGMRIATLSNITQWMCFFKGTKVAEHVRPVLDAKIQSVQSIYKHRGIGDQELVNLTLNALDDRSQVKDEQRVFRDGTDTEDEVIDDNNIDDEEDGE